MSSRDITLDLSRIVEDLISYATGKGQVPDLPRFLIFLVMLRGLERVYGFKLIDVNILIERYSVNAPAKQLPLWVKFIETVTKINSRTEIVQQVGKRKEVE